MNEPQFTHVRVAPPSTMEKDPGAINFCEHCDHCIDNMVRVCGACKGQLELHPESRSPRDSYDICAACRLDYRYAHWDETPTYLDPEAYACMTPRDENASETSRFGWCYLPAGHTSPHYYLKSCDL